MVKASQDRFVSENKTTLLPKVKQGVHVVVILDVFGDPVQYIHNQPPQLFFVYDNVADCRALVDAAS
ncbi:hypothetical protein ABKN59_009173 [Abortiporus biennis]